jgi:hypothetical protein
MLALVGSTPTGTMLGASYLDAVSDIANLTGRRHVDRPRVAMPATSVNAGFDLESLPLCARASALALVRKPH